MQTYKLHSLKIKSVKAKMILFALAMIFLASCAPSPEEKYNRMLSAYQKLSPDSLDVLLCKSINIDYLEFDSIKVELLLKAGADANCKCTYVYDEYDLLFAILTFGAGDSSLLYSKRYVTTTPTRFFFKKEHIPMLETCFSFGGKIDSTEISNTTNLELWEYLFSKGWTIKNFRNIDNEMSKDSNAVNFLIRNGFDINSPIDENTTLFYALSLEEEEDDTTQFAFLYAKGADMNKKPSNNSYEPIFHVIDNHQTKVFRWMLAHGAKTEGLIANGMTLLQYIINSSKNDALYDMVLALFENNPAYKMKDCPWNTLSFDHCLAGYAMRGKNHKILALLMDKNAEIEAKNQYLTAAKENAFEYAVNQNDPTALSILLSKKGNRANLGVLIKSCQSSIDWKTEHGFETQRIDSCLQILVQHQKR
jgi:hypothetical protein